MDWRTDDLFAWMRERHAIYERRAKGLPKPWTQDPILQAFRFCNVYRELDTVTEWLRTNWREPWKEDPNLWFAMAAARLINWPATLEEVAFALRRNNAIGWRPETFLSNMRDRAQRGEKVYTGAYMLRGGEKGTDKASYTAEILSGLWAARGTLAPKRGDSLAVVHTRLAAMPGMGSFLAGQVVCDTKYVGELTMARDWWTWAASGPGSQRGLNRVVGNPVQAPWNELEWLSTLRLLHRDIEKLVKRASMPMIHAQDLQNCLCEFDKYERVRLGEGRPRSTYPGRA